MKDMYKTEEQLAFELALVEVMSKHNVKALVYTIDDDGIWAWSDEEEWNIGWPIA